VIITNAALRGREGTWDVHIENAAFGSIVASPADSDNRGGSSDADRFDAAGRLAVEPFVDAHVHLDYANTVGRPRPNESGTFVRGHRDLGRTKGKGPQ
jgi:cytosine deaminase